MKQLTLQFSPIQLDLFEWRGIQWWVWEQKLYDVTMLHAKAWADYVFQPSPWMKMWTTDPDGHVISGGHNIQVPFNYVPRRNSR